MLKFFLKFFLVLIIGAVGGILSTQILWPYFIEKPFFEKYKIKETPTQIIQKEEIRIQENTALTEAIEKIQNKIVVITSKTSFGKWIDGSGVVITNDGLVLTLASLVPAGTESYLFLDGKKFTPTVLKRDYKNNLALLKIEQTNLGVAPFVKIEDIKLGDRVFLLWASFKNEKRQNSVNEGIIKTFNEDFVETNITETYAVQGSPLFNIKGEMIGLNILDATGKVKAISIQKIKDFTGF